MANQLLTQEITKMASDTGRRHDNIKECNKRSGNGATSSYFNWSQSFRKKQTFSEYNKRNGDINFLFNLHYQLYN